MNAYVCVYRRHLPAERDFSATEGTAGEDCSLQKFLQEYLREDRYFDWGDDPSFFAASEFLGDACHASWGVCRPDVRSRLRPGDFVVFFCAKPHTTERVRCDYFFIGVGTVAEAVDRRRIWTELRFAPYRHFYNLLGAPDGGDFQHIETFHPFHRNWRQRLTPYILFDPCEELTSFNLDSPVRVATYTGSVPETWRSRSSEMVARLEALLFIDRGVSRRLRTSRTGFSHPPINLSRPFPAIDLSELRSELLAILERAAQHDAAPDCRLPLLIDPRLPKRRAVTCS